jgi:hypothetical protein
LILFFLLQFSIVISSAGFFARVTTMFFPCINNPAQAAFLHEPIV